MKTWYNNIFILFIFSLVLFACEKEEERAVLTPGNSPTLNVSQTDLVLTEETANETATTFNWTPADFGYNAGLQYTLQFDLEGKEFEEPVTRVYRGTESQTLSGEDLNEILLELGVEPETETNIKVRVVANAMGLTAVSPQVDPLISNPVNLSVTPYSMEVTYPTLYVPGGYQGWDPATATTLISVEDNGIYEGYVTFTEGQLTFKITSEPSWDGTNYGDGGEGVLSAAGGDLSVPNPGTYYIIANTSDLSWEATPGGWAIIGDATPGGWDADTDMTYNREEDIWTITTDLTPGTFKFRFDNDWGANYGLDEEGNFVSNGQTNIPIEEAGTYEITLDLSNEENPEYSVTQL